MVKELIFAKTLQRPKSNTKHKVAYFEVKNGFRIDENSLCFRSRSLFFSPGLVSSGGKVILSYHCHINEKSGKLEVGGASRDSTGFGALDEGLISS